MFVSHDMKSNKKRFQKPNILRKKPVYNKPLIVNALDKPQACESFLTPSFVLDHKSNKREGQQFINLNYANHDYSIETSELKANDVKLGPCNSQNVEENNRTHNSSIYVTTIHQNNLEYSQNHTVNSKPILIGDMINQNGPVLESNTLKNKEKYMKQKLYMNMIQDPETIIIKHIHDTEPGLLGYVEQTDIPTISKPIQPTHQESTIFQGDTVTQINKPQTISMEQLIIKTSTKFKCDIPDCNKEFMNKQKLNKHIVSVHNKDKNTKPKRQITVECPVKRVLESGEEQLCGRIFHVRDELINHLNEEHTIDEAVYSCTECDRRFFWASGLRAHARAHLMRAGRAELACPWPGCERVFRQPCRLREHSRAHTGDRPYPCSFPVRPLTAHLQHTERAELACPRPGCERVFRQPCRLREHSRAHTGDRPYPCSFPNCGWSFRTASKLVRHARRHTGERRHACGACGRAFLRREHLRDHAQRHTAPQRRARHACPRDDCQQSFTNMSSLYMHMKKVHKDEQNGPPAVGTSADHCETRRVKADNMFVVSLLEPKESTEIENAKVEGDWVPREEAGKLEAAEFEEVGELGEEGELEEVGELEEEGELGEAHAARTHCTWPLPRAHHYQPSAYFLEEDVQVEQSEGSESNIYTVRSDLFLHGNVLHSEDSEQMAECARGAGAGAGAAAAAGAALDADLLLDAPSVHLDQEELYTDAVDEASFRVFLLTGEEL